jgi:hypothetical protein
MPDVQWYYARNDQPMGPISASELKQLVDAGELKPDDLLWHEGMDEWTTAINLRGLFSDDPPSGGKPGAATPTVDPAAEKKPSTRRPVVPPIADSARARLHSLVRTTQTILWTTCVLVVLVGVVLFTRAFLQAEDPTREAAAGAVFATFFIAAYVLARCGEKLSRLLLSHSRRRK